MVEVLLRLSNLLGGAGVLLLVVLLGIAWVAWYAAIRNATRDN